MKGILAIVAIVLGLIVGGALRKEFFEPRPGNACEENSYHGTVGTDRKCYIGRSH